MRVFFFITGFLILLLIEIGRIYFIMPFPGSQQSNTIDLAYFLQSHLGLIRLAGFSIMTYPLYWVFKSDSRGIKWTVSALLVFYVLIFYLFNYRFLADKMFYQPKNKILATVANNKVDSRQLVLGVFRNGDARAYPIEIIGYHHQVRDVVGGEPIMVTYCTVCRTGRVFSPKVDGKMETFRLVGMDHFNAMFEDSSTHSWWRQVSGEAIAGVLKGKALNEIPSEQMTLSAWINEHPGTLILQPDTLFSKEYEGLKNYGEGSTKGSLTRSDSASWKNKSWVVGVQMGLYAKAYDWNDLKKYHVINDSLAGTPIVVVLENDGVSFHVWKRIAGQDTLIFTYDFALRDIIDKKTGDSWNWSGRCLEGNRKGAQLQELQSYQEFWHSWRTFHPQTTQYKFVAKTSKARA